MFSFLFPQVATTNPMFSSSASFSSWAPTSSPQPLRPSRPNTSCPQPSDPTSLTLRSSLQWSSWSLLTCSLAWQHPNSQFPLALSRHGKEEVRCTSPAPCPRVADPPIRSEPLVDGPGGCCARRTGLHTHIHGRKRQDSHSQTDSQFRHIKIKG